MPTDRAALGTDGLVKLVLVLAVVWLGLEVVEEFVGVLDALGPLVGLAIVVVLVLYLTGRL
jgi:hypothetical protein